MIMMITEIRAQEIDKKSEHKLQLKIMINAVKNYYVHFSMITVYHP